MGRNYSIAGDQNAAAATTLIGVTGAATIRPRLYYLTIGASATPADQANNMQVLRSTAAGTSTAVTPQAIDPGDPAALASAGSNHTLEPTYTAGSIMLSFSFNSRANFQWYANPGKEIVVPATAANGLGLRFVVATGTQLHEGTFHYEE